MKTTLTKEILNNLQKEDNKMKTLAYSDIKALMALTDRETVEAFINGDGFYNTDYAIYSENEATQEVYNIYRDDMYILGCFNASFLVDYLPLDYDDIKTMQEGKQFEILGKLAMNSGKFEEMMDDYISADGYGHALSSYDGNCEEITINGERLIIIRQN